MLNITGLTYPHFPPFLSSLLDFRSRRKTEKGVFILFYTHLTLLFDSVSFLTDSLSLDQGDSNPLINSRVRINVPDLRINPVNMKPS